MNTFSPMPQPQRLLCLSKHFEPRGAIRVVRNSAEGPAAQPAPVRSNKTGGHIVSDKQSNNAYWSANLRLIIWSLVIWAVVSFGFGILLRPMLAGISVGGSDLGFWFAQQGSILVFLALIFFYAWRMNKLDAEHGVGED